MSEPAKWTKEHRARQRSKGLCGSCMRPAIPTKQWCATHEMGRRQAALKSSYGITLAQYREMWEAQQGCCAICGKAWHVGNRQLAVDHNHKTKLIRGLLCWRCNTALGKLMDNPSIIAGALAYITTNWASKGWKVPK